MLEEMSRVRVVNRQSDKIIAYNGDHYVCLMKLFPMCMYGTDVPEDDYRRFHLRFYLPREYVIDARKKMDKILIMTNGLDEFTDYSLYDQLGSRFASRGLPAVLIPLPDHLNRHTRYRISSPDARQIKEKPSETMMREPITLYTRFLQFKDELAQLRGHIDGTTCQRADEPCSFYRHLFAPHVRISYLGFSVGAATMVSDFLEEEASLNACFLLSGAIKLPDIMGRRMFPRQWDKFIKKLMKEFREQPAPTNRLFEEIFLGQYIRETPELLRKHGRRMLFIYGGKDNFTSYKNIEAITPEAWGSGLLVLPGINHFLTIDEEWKKWIELVVKLISDFEENAARLIFTKEELRRGDSADEDQSETELREREEQRYRASLLEIPQRMAERDDDKRRLQEYVEATALEDLPLASMLFKKGLISFEELNDGLTEQSRCKGVRIGDVLVDVLRMVPREQVEELASIQHRPRVF